jgi:hypothetical protein
MIAERLLLRLEGVRQNGSSKWMARCPAHDDGTPSLSVTDLADRVLIHCFSGCAPDNITAAVGLSLADLFPPKLLGHSLKPAKQRLVSPGQALEIVAKEALFVCVVASQIARGEGLSSGEKERLFLATGRIHEAYRAAL